MTTPADERRGAPSAPDGVWAPGRRLLTTGLVLTVTLVASEALAIGAVMPDVEDDLGARWLYGWVFSAFFLGGLVGITLAGRAADRTHPWRPFALGLVLFSGGLLAGGLAPSMPVLVAARLAQGIGAGALPATAYVCIARAYPGDFRPRMFALLSTAWVIPGVVGPTLAVSVGDRFGWRWVFLGLLPVVVVAGALAVRAVRTGVPSVPPQANQSGGLRDAVLVALAAGAVLAALTSERWVVGVPVALLAGALGLRPYRRLTPDGTLRARAGLPATVLARGVLTAAFFSADAFVSLAIRDVRGAGPAAVAVALTGATLLWTAGAWVQERRVGVVGPRTLIRGGFVVLVATWLVAGVALGPRVPLAVLVGAVCLSGFAMGPAYAALSVTALAEATAGAEGRATSALQLTDVLGTALGTGLAGALVSAGDSLGTDLRWSLSAVFALGAGLAVVGVALAARIPARLPTAAGAG